MTTKGYEIILPQGSELRQVPAGFAATVSGGFQLEDEGDQMVFEQGLREFFSSYYDAPVELATQEELEDNLGGFDDFVKYFEYDTDN